MWKDRPKWPFFVIWPAGSCGGSSKGGLWLFRVGVAVSVTEGDRDKSSWGAPAPPSSSIFYATPSHEGNTAPTYPGDAAMTRGVICHNRDHKQFSTSQSKFAWK